MPLMLGLPCARVLAIWAACLSSGLFRAAAFVEIVTGLRDFGVPSNLSPNQSSSILTKTPKTVRNRHNHHTAAANSEVNRPLYLVRCTAQASSTQQPGRLWRVLCEGVEGMLEFLGNGGLTDDACSGFLSFIHHLSPPES